VQVNQIVDKLPRVDIPASWVDVVVEADQPFAVEPLFTRDPRHINDLQILIVWDTTHMADDIARKRGLI
jgi:malonate decarboxylase alpha subunit